MKILHLPYNIASLIYNTNEALKGYNVETKGLIIDTFPVHTSENLIIIERKWITSENKWSIIWIINRLLRIFYFLRYFFWADILHWYNNAHILPFNLDLKLIKFFNKPAVIEWCGADIRIPEIEFKDNPFYKKIYYKNYEYKNESILNSRKNQKEFTEAGFESIFNSGMLQYKQDDIIKRFHKIEKRLLLSEYRYESENVNKIPLIIHAPTAPIGKGTSYVLKTISKLKKKYKFDFLLITGISRTKTIEYLKKADILLDQFIVGDYGMLGLEAMALGKVVVCYIKPSLKEQYPSELPIINATIITLERELEQLLIDNNFRKRIGKKSRAYVQKYHDAKSIAKQLIKVYKQIISRKND